MKFPMQREKHALRVSLVIATVAKVLQAGLWLVVRVNKKGDIPGCTSSRYPIW